MLVIITCNTKCTCHLQMRNITERSSHLAIFLGVCTLPQCGFNPCAIFAEYEVHINGVVFIVLEYNLIKNVSEVNTIFYNLQIKC